MMDFKKETIEELSELSKYYEIIDDFVKKYNLIKYVDFDYHIVHDFTLFIVDPDFDFEKLEAQIARIIKVLPPIKRIFTKPVLHLAETDEILPIEAVKKINNDTINHIARHSELWDDVSDDGIKPLKLLTRMYYDNYGIYENLVFCKAIDDILFFVRKNMKVLKNFDYLNQSIQFDLLQRVNHLNYFLALGKLHTGYIRNFDKYSVVSKHCMSGLNNIYNTIIPRLKRPVYKKNKARPKKIKKTNILAMHREYKHIYSLEKYFINNKIEVNLDFDEKKYKALEKNYFGFCTILSIFAIGHFNFNCQEDAVIDYKKLDIAFNFKEWKLKLKHCSFKNYKTIVLEVKKDISYKIVLVPYLNLEEKEEVLELIKENCDADEYIMCFPYERNTYDVDECCIDISNLESFRRIQQLVLRAMIYSDKKREDCPFCNHTLIKGNDDKNTSYECEGCRTVIVDSVCPDTNNPYSYTDILGYEKEELDISKYKNELWMYYRKKESLMHFRNITELDEEGTIICPKCKKIH